MRTAVVPPPELARGAEMASPIAWTTPRTAEAVPAMWVAWPTASAVRHPV